MTRDDADSLIAIDIAIYQYFVSLAARVDPALYTPMVVRYPFTTYPFLGCSNLLLMSRN